MCLGVSAARGKPLWLMSPKASIPERGEEGCQIHCGGVLGLEGNCAAREGLRLGGQLVLHPRFLCTTQNLSRTKLKLKLLGLHCHCPVLTWAAGFCQPMLCGKEKGRLSAVMAGVNAQRLNTCF